jgi:hypothetical protein
MNYVSHIELFLQIYYYCFTILEQFQEILEKL